MLFDELASRSTLACHQAESPLENVKASAEAGIDDQNPPLNTRLSAYRDKSRGGPAVISFNRGLWCPYCKLDLRDLAAANDRIRALRARVVSIMPDRAQYTAGLSLWRLGGLVGTAVLGQFFDRLGWFTCVSASAFRWRSLPCLRFT